MRVTPVVDVPGPGAEEAYFFFLAAFFVDFLAAFLAAFFAFFAILGITPSVAYWDGSG